MRRDERSSIATAQNIVAIKNSFLNTSFHKLNRKLNNHLLAHHQACIHVLSLPAATHAAGVKPTSVPWWIAHVNVKDSVHGLSSLLSMLINSCINLMVV